ncbi:hypothetical protein GQ53DRAFT_263113 [Thozetella sp. PMI_491]|nr:hypothetical protein GQ53DRAFT_263113 [Thozetella sp. PMI_491]
MVEARGYGALATSARHTPKIRRRSPCPKPAGHGCHPEGGRRGGGGRAEAFVVGRRYRGTADYFEVQTQSCTTLSPLLLRRKKNHRPTPVLVLLLLHRKHARPLSMAINSGDGCGTFGNGIGGDKGRNVVPRTRASQRHVSSAIPTLRLYCCFWPSRGLVVNKQAFCRGASPRRLHNNYFFFPERRHHQQLQFGCAPGPLLAYIRSSSI